MVGVDIAVRGEIEKGTAHRHHAQVLCGELDLRVVWVKHPATGGCALRFALRCHIISSIANEITRFVWKRNDQSCSLAFQSIHLLYESKCIQDSSYCQGC